MGVNIGQGTAENPDKGYQLYITALVMVILSGLVVLGRLAARWAKKSYGYDDYAIIVSLVRLLRPHTDPSQLSPLTHVCRSSPSPSRP